MVACFVLEMYPTIRLTQSMWPLCGSALVLEIVIMAVAMLQCTSNPKRVPIRVSQLTIAIFLHHQCLITLIHPIKDSLPS